MIVTHYYKKVKMKTVLVSSRVLKDARNLLIDNSVNREIARFTIQLLPHQVAVFHVAILKNSYEHLVTALFALFLCKLNLI